MTLRVWHVSNVGDESAVHYPVNSVNEGYRLIEAVAKAQLRCTCIHSNAFGLEVLSGNEWEEWEDEDGYTISDYDVTLPVDDRITDSDLHFTNDWTPSQADLAANIARAEGELEKIEIGQRFDVSELFGKEN